MFYSLIESEKKILSSLHMGHLTTLLWRLVDSSSRTKRRRLDAVFKVISICRFFHSCSTKTILFTFVSDFSWNRLLYDFYTRHDVVCVNLQSCKVEIPSRLFSSLDIKFSSTHSLTTSLLLLFLAEFKLFFLINQPYEAILFQPHDMCQ